MGAFFACVVDAAFGGGALIQIPMLFSAYPQALPASVFGTGPAAIAAALGSRLGARVVVLYSPAALRPLILSPLILVAIYTVLRKDSGIIQRPLTNRSREGKLAILIGAGTGSFLIFLFILLFIVVVLILRFSAETLLR